MGDRGGSVTSSDRVVHRTPRPPGWRRRTCTARRASRGTDERHRARVPQNAHTYNTHNNNRWVPVTSRTRVFFSPPLPTPPTPPLSHALQPAVVVVVSTAAAPATGAGRGGGRTVMTSHARAPLPSGARPPPPPLIQSLPASGWPIESRTDGGEEKGWLIPIHRRR